ncbi:MULTISPECIES: class I SAM-dependent methyltransferase [unclassified Coleofasciculus]|uniref:class I SAM-dependent methyltransferase n=1 Tax=unclassified Coleofasciculus TaxID=2692782 RepID=UPI001D14035C|nr:MULTISPECIES: class I SAM-dependent methyltransferase [unclassified Coleofasciculus]
MNQMLEKIYNHERPDSLTNNLRKKRMAFFMSLLALVPPPLKILDVGGTPVFWTALDFWNQEVGEVDITIVNINPKIDQQSHSNVKCLRADARDLSQFEDNEFDVVFSNSVIEHVGDYEEQHKMANEVMRVGKRYFVQTPNFYFPIEPHFVLPLFQFLPIEF